MLGVTVETTVGIILEELVSTTSLANFDVGDDEGILLL